MKIWPATIPALIPVYNHAGSIGAVIAGCRAAGAPYILVVDDGSTDGSGDAAAAAGADLVLHSRENRGKGHALHHGLTTLAAAWPQALSLDADLQHPPDEAARLAAAAQADPHAVWLGVRAMRAGGAPLRSRLGRFGTSVGTWCACGLWPSDNQTGLRVYPLPGSAQLPIRAGRYAYEVEALVRAVWSGIPVRRLSVAVRYPQERITHFRAVRDTCRAVATFARLAVCRFAA